MKTTLELPDELLRRAKRAALEQGTSLKAIVVKALERELGPDPQDCPPIATHVWSPPGSMPGTISGDVVLKAIRDLRDGGPDSLIDRLADAEPAEDEKEDQAGEAKVRSPGGS